MPGPKHIAGIYETCFVAAETTFGTPALSYPVGTDAIEIEEVSINTATAPFDRADKHGTPGAIFGGENKWTASGSIKKYILPSGTPATNPDDIALFTSGGWKRTVSSADTCDAGSTATQLETPSHSFAAGQFIVVAMPAADQAFQMRRIASTNANDITVTPALTAAPATGAAITAVILLEIDLARDDNQDSLTIHAIGNRRSVRGVGCAPSKTTIEMGADDGALMTMELIVAKAREFISTALNGGIAQAATSATIHNAPAVASASGVKATVGDPQYAQIDDEIITITAGGGTTGLTITRGDLLSSDVLHADDAEVQPYKPTQTTAGAIVPSTGGELFVAGAKLHADTASLEIPMGVAPQAPHFGEQWSTTGIKFEANQLLPVCTIEASADAGADAAGQQSLYLHADTMQTRAASEVFMYQGSTAGELFGFRLPSARLATSEISGSEDEPTLSMVWSAKTDTSKTSPIYLMFG